jgi:hypothetical protein
MRKHGFSFAAPDALEDSEAGGAGSPVRLWKDGTLARLAQMHAGRIRANAAAFVPGKSDEVIVRLPSAVSKAGLRRQPS